MSSYNVPVDPSKPQKFNHFENRIEIYNLFTISVKANVISEPKELNNVSNIE